MKSDIKTYNKHNYFRNTYAVYKEVNPADLPFSVWHYLSKSGSAYHYTKEGVYRKSNHWGRAAKCRWVLDIGDCLYVSKGRERIGYAGWTDFYENSESSKSYFVKVNFETKTVSYDHRSRDIRANSIYRSAKDTKKIIQKIKRLLETDSWSKYYDFENIELMREQLVLKLITTK